VSASAKLPRNWADFLHCADNKTELFRFLSISAMSVSVEVGKQLFITDGEHVFHNSVSPELDPCSQEEADTRMMVHVAHAANAGYSSIMIRTVGTDVVVLAVSSFQQLRCGCPLELESICDTCPSTCLQNIWAQTGHVLCHFPLIYRLRHCVELYWTRQKSAWET